RLVDVAERAVVGRLCELAGNARSDRAAARTRARQRRLEPGDSLPRRGGAGAAAATLVLTASRGAAAALALGLVVIFAAARDRQRLATVALLVAPAPLPAA